MSKGLTSGPPGSPRAPATASPTRISLQVIVAVVAASTLVFGLSSYLSLEGERRVLVAQVDRQAHLVSETIKSSTRCDMLLNHHEHIHQVVDNISGQGEIDQVRIFNKRGKVVYAPESALEGRLIDAREDPCSICHAGWCV